MYIYLLNRNKYLLKIVHINQKGNFFSHTANNCTLYITLKGSNLVYATRLLFLLFTAHAMLSYTDWILPAELPGTQRCEGRPSSQVGIPSWGGIFFVLSWQEVRSYELQTLEKCNISIISNFQKTSIFPSTYDPFVPPFDCFTLRCHLVLLHYKLPMPFRYMLAQAHTVENFLLTRLVMQLINVIVTSESSSNLSKENIWTI